MIPRTPNKRRHRGEGSVYYDKTNRRFVGVVQERGIRFQVTGSTAKEAADKLRVARTRAGRTPSSKLTAGEWFETWLVEAERDGHIAGGTADNYRSRLHRYIVPRLGAIRLSSLTSQDVRDMLAAAEAQKASANVRASLRTIVKSGLAEAYARELVPGNVADRVRAPRTTSSRRESIGIEQTLAFLAAARGDPSEALFLLFLANGLRFGEVAGLHPDDVDTKRSLVHVRRQVYERSGGTLEVKLPKGRKAASIPLAPIVIEPLERHLAARRSHPPAVPYLFTSERGHALRRSVFTRKVWHQFREQHGLPYMVPHQLRHTTGTLLKALGVPIEVVKEILRHASVETTDRFYQDEIPALQSDALAKLSTLLGGVSIP